MRSGAKASGRHLGGRKKALNPVCGVDRNTGSSVSRGATCGSVLLPLELKAMVEQVLSYKPKANLGIISKAYDYCVRFHFGQLRDSGEPYSSHPIAVAKMVINMKLDESAIATALLHDAIEDTSLTLEMIRDEFSDHIASLVDGVTKLRKISFHTKEIQQSENFRKLFLALSKDIRVVIVKFCDRLHNMQTTEFKPQHKRNRIALETMEIYAPLAERLGMQDICDQLQDSVFKVLNPVARSSIASRLEDLKQSYNSEIGTNNIVSDIQNMICDLLRDAGIDNILVLGREKSKYSIWQKLMNKKVSFSDLCDAVAFRVVTSSTEDCYRALGAIHQAYHAVPETFTDYISTPKANGYRSIHTAILGPFNHKIEIQIRTQEMDVQASYGLAAHWQYKQGSAADLNSDADEYKQAALWIQEVLEMMQETKDAEEFLEATKLEMHSGQIFAFSQKGEMVALPLGATVLDFAFATNSKVAVRCFGADINGEFCNIEDKINNGDKVRIITNDSVVPNESWLSKCITGRAQIIIRHKIKQTPDKIVRNSGRKFVYDIFHEYGILHNEANLSLLVSIFDCKDLPHLYTKAHFDKDCAKFIIESNLDKFTRNKKLPIDAEKMTAHSPRSVEDLGFDSLSRYGSLFVLSTKSGLDVISAISQCCKPTTGDNIVGIALPGFPVFIHSQDCECLKNVLFPLGSKFTVSWSQIHPR